MLCETMFIDVSSAYLWENLDIKVMPRSPYDGAWMQDFTAHLRKKHYEKVLPWTSCVQASVCKSVPV